MVLNHLKPPLVLVVSAAPNQAGPLQTMPNHPQHAIGHPQQTTSGQFFGEGNAAGAPGHPQMIQGAPQQVADPMEMQAQQMEMQAKQMEMQTKKMEMQTDPSQHPLKQTQPSIPGNVKIDAKAVYIQKTSDKPGKLIENL